MKKLFIFFFFLGVYLPSIVFSQTEFQSKRFYYSFTVAAGWEMKDRLFDYESDAKYLDGKGNSFKVKCKISAVPNQQTAKEYWEMRTDKEIDSLLSTTDCKAKLTERGKITVDGKEFYYIFSTKKCSNNTKFVNRSYYINIQKRAYVINTNSVDPENDQVKSDIEAMVKSFKFD